MEKKPNYHNKLNHSLVETHLEKVILVHNTAVGQSLDQFSSQSGFTTISNPVKTKKITQNEYCFTSKGQIVVKSV